ncbi:MAG: YsnF/AvaK domain-containing protein [Candidatus Eremiobacteraeota bacterium]|nr:YsnF/AvaK domain-containing protein [Candidatus Eremiobacteraeota bacterium]
MSTYDQTYADAGTVAAVFPDRDSARDALAELHDAGFHRVWLGVTHPNLDDGGEPTLESESAGGFLESVGRFFSGEGPHGQALHDALVHHGLSEQQARRIDATIEPGNAVVTVDGNDDPGEAMRILRQSGGRFEGSGTPNVADSARGRSADDANDARRLQLREERLSVDKERVQSGEARIGKRVVSEQQSVDVPVFHEEVYVERRPAGGVAASTTPIGEGEEIRIPLSQERGNVQKRTVAREDVTIGKRRVEDTEHVSDTVRREELRVEETGIDTAADEDASRRVR